MLGMGYIILLWHSLSLSYNYFGTSGCLPGTCQAGMPSLTHKTCVQNSGAISSYVGLAAEVEIGNIWIIAIPSNTILSTSLTALNTVSGLVRPSNYSKNSGLFVVPICLLSQNTLRCTVFKCHGTFLYAFIAC